MIKIFLENYFKKCVLLKKEKESVRLTGNSVLSDF